MISDKDKQLLSKKDISIDKVSSQLEQFKSGFPFSKLIKAATISDGIIAVHDDKKADFVNIYNDAIKNDLAPCKFVPASGAATRMFKSLFEYIQNVDLQASKFDEEPYKTFNDRLSDFAFYNDLKTLLDSNINLDNIDATALHSIISQLLQADGLDYGKLPKGLLKFHANGEKAVTPFEEHLRETAGYSLNNKRNGKVHYTVSPEHHEKFEALLSDVKQKYESKYNTKFDVSFSYQKPSTDTIAANPDNTPFRTENDELLFRPGGHGALIENLNDLKDDIIFIKNIDNVVPEHLQADTIEYKKILAGLLLSKRETIHGILNNLEDKRTIKEGIQAGIQFLKDELQIDTSQLSVDDLAKTKQFIHERLNRPIRVCGMVKNEGEPGGGPFWVEQSDGSVTLQVVEGAQIDPSDSAQQDILNNSTHFNPVDLVCFVKDYKGQKFNLLDYIDHNTGFISEKTQNGKELKALELPGLWNGAMANWLTFFVEVPITTFNPVKTVMDLLRPQHQPQ
ncbi:DUF4301 family protein [Carboxylicivirga sp. N1Y90]|uniref:DUF4301 family protein n=1 Tax=Carboxylicivirga fragile TaxID=3417571 RepID=UPI003D3313ED|nr:DUF4301 family protein [Marinilabiliaceae bacterium N1Y90]